MRIFGDCDFESKSIKFDYSDNDLIYKGGNALFDAVTSDSNWQIYKYTWNAGNLIALQGPIIGSWDNRENLGWE